MDEIEIIKQVLKREAFTYDNREKRKQISIISPYKRQKSKLIYMLKRDPAILELKKKLDIKIDTVDSIQGHDSEVLIFSITRNLDTGFFLK